MFKYACHRYCRKCGGTNLWFVSHAAKTAKGEPRIKNLNICKECYNEDQRKRTEKGFWRTEKVRAMCQKYRNENRDKRRIWNAEYKLRKKIKERNRINEKENQCLL